MIDTKKITIQNSKLKIQNFLFLLFIALVGCINIGEIQPDPNGTGPVVLEEVKIAEDEPAVSQNENEIVDTDRGARELTVIYTNDEHGWLEGMSEGRGAAEIVDLWEKAGCDDNCLVLSGGDMWTGPAISTWVQGESMAEVMNAMGYSAAAVGNHEFDFGLDVLKERADASTFPFVSANIRNADGSTPTEWGIERFVIVEVNEVRVGITGLTTLSTPVTTKPQNVSEFDFLSYETALREVVPEMRSAGAELILVPGHICQDEVTRLAGAGLDIDLVGGGHCNELFSSERNGVISLIGGFHLGAFAVAEIEFDTGSDEVVSALVDTVQNNGGSPDREVQRVVSKWQGVVEDELNTVIGYLDAPIERRSAEMQNLTTYAWLEGYPSADFAVTNLGGMRARFPSGEISLADLIGVMPFDNVIVSVELTGDEFLRTFGNREAAIGGIQQAGSRWIVDATGEEIDRNEMYTVLVNDFMWGGGDGYDLQRFDPDGYNTAIDWRQPVIDWMIAQESSRRNPIDEAVNALGR